MTTDASSRFEQERLKTLHLLNLLDTNPDPGFDRITALAKTIFDVPMVAVSLVDHERQWFKSAIGLPVCQTAREIAFCDKVIKDGELLIVEDAHTDPKFASNELVTGEPFIRFYAGVPIRPLSNFDIGTLCIIDTVPRQLNDKDKTVLLGLAEQVEELIRHHYSRIKLERESLENTQALARYSAIVSEAAAGIIRINSQGLIQDANPFILNLLGYQLDELLHRNVSCLMPAPWAQGHDRYISTYLEGRPPTIIGTGREVLATHKSGQLIPVHLAVSQVKLTNGQPPEFIGILSDLSALRNAQQREQAERELLKAIIDASSVPIYVKDVEGRYIIANQASINVMGLTELENGDYLPTIPLDDEDDQSIADADARVLASGKPEKLTVRQLQGQHRVLEITKSAMHDSGGRIRGIVNVAHDITPILEANTKISEQQQLLSVLHRGLTDYSALMSGDQLWAFLKQALRKMTRSDFALIGEVIYPNAVPSLKIHAITDLSWSEESRNLMEKLKAGDFLLNNPHTLLGRVFAGGETVLTTDLASEPRRSGFPPGHPPLQNYLGVPIFDNEQLIGMYAIANIHKPLNDDLVTWLQPFTATCSLLIKLYRQMDDRARFTEELRQARDEQERASRAKTEFLSSMSHELRTPLNSILGFSQLLLSSRKSPLSERQETQARQIFKSGQHLLTLINEVLDLARIESGAIGFSIEPIALEDVISESLDTVSSIAEAAGIRVLRATTNSARKPRVMADYTRLKQVLINLLSNAIKYNTPQGSVRLEWARHEDHTYHIRIIDTGIGIDNSRLDELFQPFSRLGAENTAIEGTGVGLALTKKLVENMKGRIGVHSEQHKGSEFWISLPAADDGNDIPTVADSTDPATTDVASPLPSLQRRVLYVEDNPANQRLMMDVFEDLDEFQLICAYDAPLGIELARVEQPALIIMDINLPGMDGFQARRLLAQDSMTRHIPVIALSANAMRTDIDKGLSEGFTDYLTKPFDISKLINAIETYARQD
ncbi:PAS domain S-box protein [Pokkaliibacter plantistimulans]|uniref:hybrid sensor histidine kinase/response regulator n=1 Tax=Pokkaliibacter plantistimulans TaxID=1635171 RepID=UPI001401D260|nr:PAS domain S-box protein [Pokkaliibacter plantistimulans]